jgi:hypothetical protein
MRCAVDVQRGMAERNGQFSLIEGIMVRGAAANRYRVREGA